MSGPKVSVYELSPAQKKRFFEQQKILNQTEVCIQTLLKKVAGLETNTAKVSTLTSEGIVKCKQLKREGVFEDISCEITELQNHIQEIMEEYDRIQQLYRKDKDGFIKLSVEMDQQRANRLKALEGLCERVDMYLWNASDLKQKALKTLNDIDDELSIELHKQVLGGFTVSFNNLRAVSNNSREKSPNTQSSDNTENIKKIYMRKIIDSFDLIAEMIGSTERLSPELKDEQLMIKQKAAEITSVDFLKNYYAITVMPFVKKCQVYAELLDTFDELYVQYHILCDKAGTAVQKYDYSKENIDLLRLQIKTLEERIDKDNEKEYVRQALDEAMEEMGYSLVGHRESIKKSGRKVKHKLYHFGDGTGVDITFGTDGQITMELGGFDERDRLPDASEANELTENMMKFCGEYEALGRILEKKGVQRKNLSLMPPTTEFATIFNIIDYDMVKPVSKYEVKREKKTVQKAHHSK